MNTDELKRLLIEAWFGIQQSVKVKEFQRRLAIWAQCRHMTEAYGKQASV